MKFGIDIRNHKFYHPINNIVESNIKNVDFLKLEIAIKEFNEEIKWNQMWDVGVAKKRLRENWRLLLFLVDTNIKGWYWLDNNKEPKNLYINKEYRNRGVGKEMHLVLLNLCKKMGMERVECHIDDWNESSKKCIKNAGWSEI